MSLRAFQLILSAALIAASVTLWRRDLALRREYEAGGARLAELSAGLAAERRKAEGLREDLAELRGQLDRTRRLRDEAQSAAVRERETYAARTKEWSKAVAGWEEAVKARDARLAEMSAREKQILARLDEAVRHAEAAAKRAEELRRRLEEADGSGDVRK